MSELFIVLYKKPKWHKWGFLDFAHQNLDCVTTLRVRVGTIFESGKEPENALLESSPYGEAV